MKYMVNCVYVLYICFVTVVWLFVLFAYYGVPFQEQGPGPVPVLPFLNGQGFSDFVTLNESHKFVKTK